MKYPLLYFILLFCIPLIPRFDAIDIIAIQWFSFSILNSFFIFFLIIKKKLFSFSVFFKHARRFYLLYISFLFFSLLSLFFAKNLNLAIIDIFRIFNVFIAIILSLNFFSFKNFNFTILYYLVSIFLFIDVFFCFYPYLEYSFINDINFFNFFQKNYSSDNLKGLNANKNITAAYICLKIPFVFLSADINKNKFIKIIFYFLISLSALAVLLLQSRASYISLFLIFIFYFSYYIFKKSRLSISLLFLFTLPFFISKNISNDKIVNEIKSINISSKSSNSRFSLWENAIDASVNNKFLGFGLGNWKIESLPYWNKNGDDYVVPYHAHNDFLELLTEIGLLGALSYFLFFVTTILYLLFLFLKKKQIIFLSLFLSILVYFIDANLNFPLERTSMQLFFALLFSLSFINTNHEKHI